MIVGKQPPLTKTLKPQIIPSILDELLVSKLMAPRKIFKILPTWRQHKPPKPIDPGFPLEVPSQFNFKAYGGGAHHKFDLDR